MTGPPAVEIEKRTEHEEIQTLRNHAA